MGAFQKKKAEYVVVGSGPGGATVARELARAGKDVLLLEKGEDHREKWYYGTHLGGLIYCERRGFLCSDGGIHIVQGAMTGGSTNLYCAAASRPPAWMKTRFGLDLDAHVDETSRELGIAPLPQPLWGLATQRVVEAAAELGHTWAPQPKFVNVSRGEPFDCGSRCMLGCRCGAKWTANDYLDEAVRLGCRLMTGAQVKEIVVADGAAAGVVATMSRGTHTVKVEAGTVILAAGAISTPVLLQHNGIPQAGHGITMNTTAMVYGKCRGEGMFLDPPMAASYLDEENGIMLSTMLDPWMIFARNLPAKDLTNPGRLLGYGKTMGIMIKLQDEISGGVNMEGKVSKSLTDRDSWRLNQASILCRQILVQAGCDADSIFMSSPLGTDPGGTVRINDLLSANQETAIRNLYVSDASVLPEALGRPPVLTLVCLAKRLGAHLVEKASPPRKKPASTSVPAVSGTPAKTAAPKKAPKKAVKKAAKASTGKAVKKAAKKAAGKPKQKTKKAAAKEKPDTGKGKKQAPLDGAKT